MYSLRIIDYSGVVSGQPEGSPLAGSRVVGLSGLFTFGQPFGFGWRVIWILYRSLSVRFATPRLSNLVGSNLAVADTLIILTGGILIQCCTEKRDGLICDSMLPLCAVVGLMTAAFTKIPSVSQFKASLLCFADEATERYNMQTKNGDLKSNQNPKAGRAGVFLPVLNQCIAKNTVTNRAWMNQRQSMSHKWSLKSSAGLQPDSLADPSNPFPPF